MDDGKVNVLGPAMLQAINDALDRAEGENAGAVVIAGNERVFSGGFDLKVFRSGDVQASIDMLKGGFTLSHRLLSFPSRWWRPAPGPRSRWARSWRAASITESPRPRTPFRPTRWRSGWCCPTRRSRCCGCG
jgi:hypothetical protein